MWSVGPPKLSSQFASIPGEYDFFDQNGPARMSYASCLLPSRIIFSWSLHSLLTV